MKNYRDHFFLKAKQENYPARSVYKLKEMDKRFRILKPAMKVLDLGAAPGSWSLAASEKVGRKGHILAADVQGTLIVFPENITFMQENVFERSSEFEEALLEYGPFDLVMSDMAPFTTGNNITDQSRSLALCEQALEIAKLHLKPGGTFIVKIFMGPDVQEYLVTLRKLFDRVQGFKPLSSRSESKEIFYLGFRFKQQPLKIG